MNIARSLKQFHRTIYLHRGHRISGLKKDPLEVFTVNGISYDNIENNVKHVHEFLTEKYPITDELALQVLTHKSFGNAIKPHNEKLSAMGSKLLNLYFAKYVINKPTTNQLAINDKNLDVLGQPIAKELSGRLALGIFAKTSNLNRIMFWNSYSQGLSFEKSGELKVSAQMMYALIGAIDFSHGKLKAEEFITEMVAPSIEAITKDIIQTNTVNRTT